MNISVIKIFGIGTFCALKRFSTNTRNEDKKTQHLGSPILFLKLRSLKVDFLNKINKKEHFNNEDIYHIDLQDNF